MPDFAVRVTNGASATGLWTDPAVGEKPSRVNFREAVPQRYLVGHVNTEIELSAVVDGVVGPLDPALSGRLFKTWFVEAPGLPIWMTKAASDQSSVQRFTPKNAGHYTIGFERPDGGIVHVHIDVEESE